MSARLNVVDHPALLDALFLALVGLHAGLSAASLVPNLWAPLTHTDVAAQAGLYLGFFGAAALVSSFSGVVVIFGLTPQSLRFRRFRINAGGSLVRNWTWTSSVGFLGAALALAAAIASLSGGAWLAPWFLELAIFLVSHSAVRLVLLLKGLVKVVRADDVVALREAADRPASAAPWNQTN
jgi:hypothetical protein